MFKDRPVDPGKAESVEKKTEHVEIEYQTLKVSYDVDVEPSFQYREPFDDEVLDVRVYKITNLVFTDQSTGKTFNPDELKKPEDSFAIIQGANWGQYYRDQRLIGINELGSPTRQFYLLHEIGHSLLETQPFSKKGPANDQISTREEQEIANEEERVANAFAFQKLKEIRENGIELEPEYTDGDIERLIKQKEAKLNIPLY
jgi:Zn-dependent peptidase ImmA (M78 family)